MALLAHEPERNDVKVAAREPEVQERVLTNASVDTQIPEHSSRSSPF